MELLDIRLLKIEFYLNKEYKAEREQELVPTDIGTRNEFINETNELFVFIRVRLKRGNSPYYFEIETGGYFKFNETPDPKILETFTTINCPAIIFPYVRETIADLTRRAGFPPLHLGPINFIELAAQAKKEILEEKVSSPE